jgi:tRNA(Arg) A34 adenosine deaminase TadA
MNDAYFMREAIKEARKAFQEGERNGIGAIVVKDNQIIGIGHNDVKLKGDPTAHAEINVIRVATATLKSHRLESSTLYTTCEPCPMCFTAAWWARIPRIVYGTYLSDIINIGNRQINVGAEFLNQRGTYQISLEGGFLRDECMDLLKQNKE